MFVGIALDKVNISADKIYTYKVPEQFCDRVQVGVRVIVPFGRGNVLREGIVITDSESKTERAKNIAKVIDEMPIISAAMIEVARFVREMSFCTWYQAINAMLPLGVRIKLSFSYSVAENATPANADERAIFDAVEASMGKVDIAQVLPKKELMLLSQLCKDGKIVRTASARQNSKDLQIKSARLIVSEDEAQAYIKNTKNSFKQEKVLDILMSGDSVPVLELAYLAGVSPSVVSTLAKHGIVEIFDMQVTRNPYALKEGGENSPVVLNDEQQKAYDGLLELYEKKGAGAALLYGVTGSGKTAVYMELIARAIEKNDNVILLVPEISLTPQVTDSFVARFGKKVAVLHSGMSTGERFDQWKLIKENKVNVVIGTRSAIFAPFEKVSLIVIDEEQEHTYRSESSPRYNAKDVAKFRVAQSGGLVVFASATPSVETYAYAQAGRYALFELSGRYGKSELPSVCISDLSRDLERGNTNIIGVALKEEIQANLDDGKQTILFLNRRGYNTALSCRKCGHVFECPSCSVPMTYHKTNDMLICHYCGYMTERPVMCPDCGDNNIKYVGTGTQKLDEEILALFPNARVIRMDMDTTSRKLAHEQILGDFAKGKYDILVGTQMVTKGLNLPDVTLVGILLADGMLYNDDFRAGERAFAMLTQVCGRAGRDKEPGRAVIQTFSPENSTIALARKQDYKAFFKEEIAFRKLMRFPPYCDIYQLVLSAGTDTLAKDGADKLCEQLKAKFTENNVKNVMMYPPLPSSVSKIAGRYRYRILIKCRDDANIRAMMRECVSSFSELGKVDVTIDLNPQIII